MNTINRSTLGLVFDIEEFAVFDGPGIRCTVFLKGCPLRCMWCHNPEGLSAKPQRVVTHSLCVHCGECERVCPSPGKCIGCGKCVEVCPRGCIRIAGTQMSAEAVADILRKNEMLLQMNDGGVTFSGGEALMQPEFVLAVRRLVPGLHALIETSGYASRNVFEAVVSEMDMVIMDIKIADPILHKRYTGVDNARILDNLQVLKSMQKPFRIRIPLIPTVNDTYENMDATAALIGNAPYLEKVELLPYNRAAGAKYSGVGMKYQPDFPEDRLPQIITEPFTRRGIAVSIM